MCHTDKKIIRQILPDIGVPPSLAGGFQRNVMTSGWWNCNKYSSVGGGTNSGQPGGLGKAETRGRKEFILMNVCFKEI